MEIGGPTIVCIFINIMLDIFTPQWIVDGEKKILGLLAEVSEVEQLQTQLGAVRAFIEGELKRLKDEAVSLADLVAQVKLSRELSAYKGNSLAARAARQLC